MIGLVAVWPRSLSEPPRRHVRLRDSGGHCMRSRDGTDLPKMARQPSIVDARY